MLQEEWLNSRGAIARFERSTIEIRVLDVQECPQADVAICALIADVLEGLTAGRWVDPAHLEAWDTETLYGLLQATIRDADRAVISDAEYPAPLRHAKAVSGHGGRSLETSGRGRRSRRPFAAHEPSRPLSRRCSNGDRWLGGF